MTKQQSVALTGFLAFSVFMFVLKSSLSLLSEFKVTTSTESSPDKNLLEVKTTRKLHPLPPAPLQPSQGGQISCDRSHYHYDTCSINGPTVLDPKTSTFYLVDSASSTRPVLVEKIRPYPRKWESFTMKRIKEIIITSGPASPRCDSQHNAPALVFSAGGHTGNFWHEFNDGFIPLFITVSSIFPDQDFILVISKARDWWVSKYADLLQTFSKHPIIDLDNDNTTHCFTSASLGLVSHGFMTIDPMLVPNSKTFLHFRAFLDKAYGYGHTSKYNYAPMKFRPRLVLASRKGGIGRVISNEEEVKRVAEEMGFEVIVFEPTSRTPLSEAYALMNLSHAMVGVHGAALTHSLFLRPGSVLVQVVPLGIDWLADACFAKSARAIGVEYMEYKIHAEESSLIDKYDKNELVIKDPVAFRGNDWSDVVMDIYLKQQNVKIGLVRFRECLKSVYEKAKNFMDEEG